MHFNNELQNDITAKIEIDSGEGKNADSIQYYLNPIDNKSLILQIDEFNPQNSLKILVESIISNNKLLLDSSEVSIQVPQEPNTSYLEILEPSANLKVVPDKIVGDALNLIFSKPAYLSSDSALLLKLFLNDSIPIHFNVKQVNPMLIGLTPKTAWEENSKYKLQVPRVSINTDSGRGLQDSIKTLRFTTTKEVVYGSITGKIAKIVKQIL